MKNTKVEVEGGEILIQSKEGHYAVIPAKHRQEVMDMIKDGCDDCINNYIQTLPKDSDYAEDGSLYAEYLTTDPPTKKTTQHPLDPNPDGSLPSYFKGSKENPIQLDVVEVTAEAPTYIKYKQSWEKENPFDINKYVEDRFNNPVGREAISRIDEKGWRETLKQEGLKKRQVELDNATKMGLLYQRFNPQGKDDIPIADEQFSKRYGTSPHRYRYDNDPEYRKYYEQQTRNATSKIDYPSTDLRRKDAVAPNNMWMYPNLTGESQKAMTDFSNEVIGMALPIPGLEAMGKIPSVFKTAKNLTKTGKVASKTDDVVNLVKREKVFDDATLDMMDRVSRRMRGEDVPVTLSEKVKIGRDWVGTKDLNKAYRNTHFDEIVESRKKGYFNNNKFPDTDWYYGGSSGKYGDIEIEAIPNEKYFRLFKNDEGVYVGINTGNPDILHLKGKNVPFDNVKIRYKGSELTSSEIEELCKVYKKGDNLDELVYSIKNQTKNKKYKEIKVPQKQFKSEIDWAKWNKEIPENQDLNFKSINNANNIQTQRINETLQRELDWLDSPEYLARKKKATGLSDIKIKKDVERIKEQIKKTEINVLDDNVDMASGVYTQDKNKPLINIFKTPNKNVTLNTIDHEIKHAASEQALETQDDLLKLFNSNYKKYPTVNNKTGLDYINPFESLSKWASNAPEQQVVSKRIMDIVEKNYGIKRGTQLSLDDVERVIAGLNKEIKLGNYENSDIIGMLSQMKKKYKSNYKFKLNDMINNAYSIGIPIGAGALMQDQEYKNGGTIGNNGMFDMTSPNIYKGLIPPAIGTGAAIQSQNQNKTKNNEL